MAQTEALDELPRVSWQSEETNNEYIENLFNREQYLKYEIPTNKIVSVYDRLELKCNIDNFFVTFLNYKSGRPIIRSIINNETRIEYWNYFHDNGEIRLKGYTIGSIQQIGVWEKYSTSGELESLIDCEKDRLNFENLYTMVKEINIANNDLNFKYSEDNKNWIIEDWTENCKYKIDEKGSIKEEKLKSN